MKGLYESILAGYSKQKASFGKEMDKIAVNAEDSKIREYFGCNNKPKVEFDIEYQDDKRYLVCKTDSRWGVEVQAKGTMPNDIKFDGIKVMGNLIIRDMHDIAQNLNPNITCNYINICCDKIDGLNVKSDNFVTGNTGIQISSDKKCVISNCNFDVEPLAFIRCNCIPTLKNVWSNSRTLEMYIDSKHWKDPIFNKLFKLNYSVRRSIKRYSEEDSDVVEINSFMDIRKMVTAGAFYSWEYNVDPYSLNDVNMTDIIDISNFPNIEYISIYDKSMGIFFQNTKSSNNFTSCYRHDALRRTWNEPAWKNPVHHMTKDGWEVIIYKR